MAAADDGIARGRGAARHEAGGAEGDGRSTDVAGSAGDGEVGLRETGAGRGGEAGEGYRETIGVDRERTVSRGAERAIVDRAVKRVRPERVRRRNPIIGGDVGAARAEQRGENTVGHRDVGSERATGEVVIADVAPARGHVDRGVAAQRHRSRQLVIEGGRGGDATVTPAEIAQAAVERATRDVQAALRTRTAEDNANLADGILAVDETTLPHRELGQALIGEDEPIIRVVGVIEHTRAADVGHADRVGIIFV